MEKKRTNSGPLREPADKHSIYPLQALGQCHPGKPAANDNNSARIHTIHPRTFF